jgi:hypothetical protein
MEEIHVSDEHSFSVEKPHCTPPRKRFEDIEAVSNPLYASD